MYLKKKWLPTIAFVSLALICAILSVFLPWWSVSTAPEAEISLNSGGTTEYGILKTISVYKRTGDEVFSIRLRLSDANVTSNQDVINSLYSVYDITIILQASGIVLAVVVLLLAILTEGKSFRRAWVFGMFISAALILGSTIYFMNNFVPSVSRLDQITPLILPKEWVPINATQIKSFFGTISIPQTSDFPSWAVGQDFWTWGAGAGFFLALTTSFMLFASVALLNFNLTERK